MRTNELWSCRKRTRGREGAGAGGRESGSKVAHAGARGVCEYYLSGSLPLPAYAEPLHPTL
eukprot:1582391-Pleurochrysis_carterae.AAC.2